MRRFPLSAPALAFLALTGLPGATPAQTPLTTKEPFLSRLTSQTNWKSFFGQPSTSYYAWSTLQPLPYQTKHSWTSGSQTITDLTRVGDGQCPDFVKNVTMTTGISAGKDWIKGPDVVGLDGHITTLPAGTAIATFNPSRHYSGEHTAIVLRRVGDALEVADQNYISGKDHAMVVGKHLLDLTTLRRYSVVLVKQ